MLVKWFKRVTRQTYKEAERVKRGELIDKYLKHYEDIYRNFWQADAGSSEDLKSIGAVYEARYLLQHIFGIEGQTLDFIQYKVEKENSRMHFCDII